ncbi:hypothetical protein F511_29434 [Dorcoceras hygrometricum]|uniref:Uncharacterized protein n=1 Tax=Dorcoceras hygrometricum TaxID=472368 RepID=A0A2Z7D8D3_9LAMI|nr:hypothetical protein F511_29434 [Dorcoceras hygrometricum]
MLTPTDAELLSAHYISGDFIVSNECTVTRRMSELMSRGLKLSPVREEESGSRESTPEADWSVDSNGKILLDLITPLDRMMPDILVAMGV